MIRKFVSPAALVIAASGTAFAGGYAEPVIEVAVPPVAAVPAAPARDWSGPFVGFRFGYGDAQSEDAGGSQLDSDGGFAGVTAGFDIQRGRGVFGVDLNYNLADIDGSNDFGFAANTYSDRVSAFGSLRARAGALVTPSTLVYVAGGYAVAEFETNYNGGPTSDSSFQGYTLGIGIEGQLANGIGLKTEINHYEFDEESVSYGAGGTFDQDLDMTTLSVSVVKRF